MAVTLCPSYLNIFESHFKSFRESISLDLYAILDDEANRRFEIGVDADWVARVCCWMQARMRQQEQTHQRAAELLGLKNAGAIWKWVHEGNFSFQQLVAFDRIFWTEGTKTFPMISREQLHIQGYLAALAFIRQFISPQRLRLPIASPWDRPDIRDFIRVLVAPCLGDARATRKAIQEWTEALPDQPDPEILCCLIYIFGDKFYGDAIIKNDKSNIEESMYNILAKMERIDFGQHERRLVSPSDLNQIVTGWGPSWLICMNIIVNKPVVFDELS